MTTDKHTPNPTPALPPPARLAAARSALDAFDDAPMGSTLQDDAAYDAARMLGPVLAHLDALTPSAAPDGEAGRRLYYALHPTAHERAWEAHDADLRARYDAQAATLVAAGRSEGEAERLRLADEVTNLRLVCSWDPTNPLDLAEARATIARLTAELAAAREEIAISRREAQSACDGMDRLQDKIDALAAELARWCKGAGVTSPEALASLLRDNLHALDAARRDGARKERERWEAREKERIAAIDRACDGNRGRARGEGQGS